MVSTFEDAGAYAQIECVGQYLLAAYLINEAFAPHRHRIGRLLDFGCGAGKSTRAIAPSVRPGAVVIGTDISAEFIELATQLTRRSIALAAIEPMPSILHVGAFDYIQTKVSGNDERIPLEDALVDAVTTTIVLQEIQSETLLRSILREMGRVAKPGAQLALAVVSDRITCEDYTSFTYAPFPENGKRTDDVRLCRSVVSEIIWSTIGIGRKRFFATD